MEIKRYVFPVEALPAIEEFLKGREHDWGLSPATHVVEIGPLPIPVTDEEFEEMVKDEEIL